jgi:hypothetical protein
MYIFIFIVLLQQLICAYYLNLLDYRGLLMLYTSTESLIYISLAAFISLCVLRSLFL